MKHHALTRIIAIIVVVGSSCTGTQATETSTPAIVASLAPTATIAPTPAVTPTATAVPLAVGWAALAENDFDRAHQIADEAIAQNALNGEAWALRGMSDTAQEDSAEAIDDLEKASELGYETAKTMERLATLHLNQRDMTHDIDVLLSSIEQARAVMMRLRQLDPSNELASKQLPFMTLKFVFFIRGTLWGTVAGMVLYLVLFLGPFGEWIRLPQPAQKAVGKDLPTSSSSSWPRY